jgi:hypothetical protein
VVHDAVAQRQRRRLVPIVPGGHAGVLADRQPQLGKDCALDLGQRQLVNGLTQRRKIFLERLIWQNLGILEGLSLSGNNTRVGPGSKPLRGLVFAVHAWFFYARTGPICRNLHAVG